MSLKCPEALPDPLGRCPRRWECSGPNTPLHTHSLARLFAAPCEAPLSSSHPGRDHTAAALAAGRADGLGASPRSTPGAANPPWRSPLPVQVRDRPGRAFGEPGPSPGTTSPVALGKDAPDLREKWMQAWGSLLSRQENSMRCLAREGRRLLSSYLLANGGGSVHTGPRDYLVLKGWPRTGASEIRSRDFTDFLWFLSPLPPWFAQPLASLSPLRYHLRPPAHCVRASGCE